MENSWTTLGLIKGYWHREEGLDLPFYFSPEVSYRKLPRWVKEVEPYDLLREELRAKVDDSGDYCIAVEYQADSLGTPDPMWNGGEPRGMQDTAAEKVWNAAFALWLAKPTAMGFRTIVHAAQQEKGTWITRHMADYDQLVPLPTYQHETHAKDDFDVAKKYFDLLNTLPREGNLRIALNATIRALTEQVWPMRFLQFWLGLESLFGATDGREITYRLSHRVALFLECDGDKAKKTFLAVKDSYGWRSKVVHGMRIASLKTEKSMSLMVDIEDVVRRSLVAIMANESVREQFESKGRDDYLDTFGFGRPVMPWDQSRQ